MNELDSTSTSINTNSLPSFKALQIVGIQSTKVPTKSQLYIVFSHRFTTVKNGFDTFFGLDGASVKFGGIYGITNWLSVGVYRSSFQKTYETTIKYRILVQNDKWPFTLVGYNALDINTVLNKKDYQNFSFKHRVTYFNQILLSRRFSESISLQISPTYIHNNLHVTSDENIDQFIVGVGGRIKLTNRLSLNVEIAPKLNGTQSNTYKIPLALGLDVETGGHVFQLLFTNSQPTTESGYLNNATGDWGKGDFYFGFNLYRVF